MAKPTLTDKKLSDKRFKRTEKAILGAFFDSDSLNVKTIAKNAGVARSTMYFHHKTVRDIVSDYEKYLLQKYVRKIHKTLMQKNIKIETILMQTMIFMMMNRYYFGIVLRGNSRTLLEKMIDVIDLRIMHEMGISKRKRRIFTIYKSFFYFFVVLSFHSHQYLARCACKSFFLFASGDTFRFFYFFNTHQSKKT